MQHGALHVDVEGERMSVTLDGTAYRAVFCLSNDKAQLIQTSTLAVDKAAPMSHKDFEALAWDAANAKAREIGWLHTSG
jgi:hypothetical protein